MAATEPDCIFDELWVAGEPVGIDGDGARQHPADRPLQAEGERQVEQTPGTGVASYQPTPNPSPLVVSAPSLECRLWSISEWTWV